MSDNADQRTVAPPHRSTDHRTPTHPVQVAIDTLHLPYRGDFDGRGVRSAHHRVEGDRQVTLLVALVVGEGRPSLLECRVVAPDTARADAVQSLLDRVTEQVTIDTLYVAPGLGGVEVLDRVTDADCPYVCRASCTGRARRHANEMRHDVTVVPEYQLAHYSATRVQTTLVLVRRSADTGDPVAYFTDCDVADLSAADRRRTRELIERNDQQAELSVLASHLRQQEVLQVIAGIGDWFATAAGGDPA